MAYTFKLNARDAELVSGALKAIVALEKFPEARTHIVELSGWTRSTEGDYVAIALKVAHYIDTVIDAG